MEDELELSFTPAAEQRSLWRQILAGLCEAMLEVWPVEYFEGQYWEEEGERFCIGLLPGSDGDEFASDLEILFALCPVQDVRVEARYGGENDE